MTTINAASEHSTTTSRVKRWYLVRFKGYTVVQCREIPKMNWFGQLTYMYNWTLRPPEGVARKPARAGERAGP